MACKLLKTLLGTMRYVTTSLLLLGGTGCVIPPPIDVDHSDGGSNSNHPPVLFRQGISPDFSKTYTWYRKAKPAELRIAIQDQDRQEIVTRLFIDRNYTSYVAEERRVSPGGSDALSFVITISGLCDDIVKSETGHHSLEVYISDSGFVETGDDLRVAQPGGIRDFGLWDLLCADPPTG